MAKIVINAVYLVWCTCAICGWISNIITKKKVKNGSITQEKAALNRKKANILILVVTVFFWLLLKFLSL